MTRSQKQKVRIDIKALFAEGAKAHEQRNFRHAQGFGLEILL